jgi:catechol 2,3-dioxygenase-like lactoylglutathione lyase family enzyme
MGMHRLTTATIGVPDPDAARGFYRDFGLHETSTGRFATADGGEQLVLDEAPTRRLLSLGVGVDTADDLEAVHRRLDDAGFAPAGGGDTVEVVEPVTGVRVLVSVAPRVESSGEAVVPNGPGSSSRLAARAPAILRAEPVRPRRLGHVVIGSVDRAATERLFTEGLGFAVSDRIADIASFLRCSTDHHNLLVQSSPVHYVHHTSWQVDDVDEVLRGGNAVLAGGDDRQVWGPGRHWIGSNHFWYLRDPAGNFAEYYADMDVIPEGSDWEPEVVVDERALYAFGPPVPVDFVAPPDLEALAATA